MRHLTWEGTGYGDLSSEEEMKKFKEETKKVKESKRSDLPSPTPLRFSKAERFDG